MATATASPNWIQRAKAPGAAASRILLYGVEGVGKSSFGAQAPNPIFLAAEDGIRHLTGAVSFPEPKGLDDVYGMLNDLAAGGHDRKSLIVDTIDWLEPVISRAVCARNGWTDLEAPGYGKGYVPFLEEWRKVLSALDRVRAAGIEIILLGHAKVTTFSNPKGADYSRYELAMNAKSAAIVKQWADFVLFANFDDMVVVAQGRGSEALRKGKGISTGARVIHTTHDAAWDAKTRGIFPPVLALDYGAFTATRAENGASMLAELSATLDAKLDEWASEKGRVSVIARVGDRTDAVLLSQVINWIEGKIAEKAQKEKA